MKQHKNDTISEHVVAKTVQKIVTVKFRLSVHHW